MQTILLDVRNENAEVIDIDDELDAFYDKLNCTCIDIVSRSIGGKVYDIMCDDEGLLKEESPKISAINDMGQPMLVGNLMFFNVDGEGELVGLSDDDVEHIKNYIQIMSTHQYLSGYPMLTQCEFA